MSHQQGAPLPHGEIRRTELFCRSCLGRQGGEKDEAQPVLPVLHSADLEVIRRFALFGPDDFLGRLVEVRDERGKLIASGIGDNKDDVILELGEDLQPPDEQ